MAMALAVARRPLPLETTTGPPGGAAGEPQLDREPGTRVPAKRAAAPAPVLRKFRLE
jgi:hypothetical protein